MKAFIFDLDGVLVSTDKYHYQAWKKMADDEGIYFDEKINDRLRGVSRMASLRHRPRQAFVQRDRLKRIVLFPALIFHESSSFLPIIQ